mgnify:CR=1 FL=1|jgi:hypothetical protein|tara:strand:- start:9489 stop:10853 length:1365 start_codon:yes stop_codon:yes gene_type:complete
MQYWYDQQIRRYILQFIRLFDSFQIKTGTKSTADSESYIRVPVRYADMSRMVAHILRHNSENVMNSAPFISAYITNLQIARDRLQEPRLVDKVQVAERKYDNSAKEYISEIGNTYTVERHMPVPYNLNMAVDIWCSNTDQKMQLMEQILVLFNPAIELQANDNPLDWTNITNVELIDIVWSSRAMPQGVDSQLDIATLTFSMPIWLNPPAKVKKQSIIKQIIARVNSTDSIDDLDYDPRFMDFFENFSGQIGTIVITPENAQISVIGNNVSLLGAYGKNDSEKWKDFLEAFGELQPGISKLILRQSADIEDSSNDVFGTLAFHPSDTNQLIFTLDDASLPSNTLTAVTKIIDPEIVYPGNTLPAATNGQRYLLVNPIPVGNTSFGSSFTAEANDIIEYNGTSWSVSFDSGSVVSTQYVTNANTGTQYRWTGSQWIDSYQGQYKNGFWKLELASS